MTRKQPSLTKIEAVYRERGADFFRLALARTGDPEQARDAVQEGFADAIRGRASYRGRGPLEAWVARCVINAAYDVAGARDRFVTALDDPAEPGYGRREIEPPADPPAEVVREAVRRLPTRQRDALF